MKIGGTVVRGDGRGRTLGYPTANIAVDADLDAVDGVYAARVWVDGDDGTGGDDGKLYGAMANLGVKPTFSDGTGRRVLEIHLFGFEGDIYGRELTIELGEFIRPEKRFPTSEALRTQIAEDEKRIKNRLRQEEPILNMEQAKFYFWSMGCSHFHLSRENINRADEYRRLHISEETESEWRRECFEKSLSEIDSSDVNELWMRYSGLGDMMEWNSFYVERMIELTDKIVDRVPTDQINLILNCTIIGNNATKTRGGLIQKAFYVYRPDLANRFAAHAKSLFEKAENTGLLIDNFVIAGFADLIDEYFELNEYNTYLKDYVHRHNITL
jgi:hypothetical protein